MSIFTAWELIWIANDWVWPNALFGVPPQAVGMIHHVAKLFC